MNQFDFRNLFWKYDIMGLYCPDLPKDEYDSKADMAFEVIDKEDSLILIHLKLLSIFHIWFQLTEPCALEEDGLIKEFVPPEFKLLDNSEAINRAAKIYDSNKKITNLAIEIYNTFQTNKKI